MLRGLGSKVSSAGVSIMSTFKLVVQGFCSHRLTVRLTILPLRLVYWSYVVHIYITLLSKSHYKCFEKLATAQFWKWVVSLVCASIPKRLALCGVL